MSLPIYNQDLGIIGILAQSTPQEYTDCITFTGETSDFTLKATYKEWDGTVEYSTDRTTWKTWDGTAISSSNKKLYLRGSGNTKFYTTNGAQFVLSAKAGCSGNLNTLLEYSNPPTTLIAQCYRGMFWNCTNLTAAPELPATTLAESCYRSMFGGCTSLTAAPALPATTLARSCYYTLFINCTSLTTAPALPATTLAVECYRGMFWNCTNLTAAPELPATTLADGCYYDMFNSCTKFKVSSSKTGSYQYAWRIPTSGTASRAPVWNASMLYGTGGTFTSDPSINTTYYVENEPV